MVRFGLCCLLTQARVILTCREALLVTISKTPPHAGLPDHFMHNIDNDLGIPSPSIDFPAPNIQECTSITP